MVLLMALYTGRWKITEKVYFVTIVLKVNMKRARCCHQKSHIWLVSHRFATPGLGKLMDLGRIADDEVE